MTERRGGKRGGRNALGLDREIDWSEAARASASFIGALHKYERPPSSFEVVRQSTPLRLAPEPQTGLGTWPC